MPDVKLLVAGSWGGEETQGKSLMSEWGEGHDGKMFICPLILKYFNILITVVVIQVHLGHISALVRFIFSLKWML